MGWFKTEPEWSLLTVGFGVVKPIDLPGKTPFPGSASNSNGTETAMFWVYYDFKTHRMKISHSDCSIEIIREIPNEFWQTPYKYIKKFCTDLSRDLDTFAGSSLS